MCICYYCESFDLVFFVSHGQWSSSSPVNQAHGFELSDDEGHFAVSYLAKQLEGTTGA